jgi:hypothetical protein
MPLAVVEQIALALKSRLDVMVDDSVNFPISVSEVVRPTRFGDFTLLDRQIVLVQGQLETVPELSHPGNPPAQAYRITFQIRGHVINDERAFLAIDETLNQFHADIVQAVAVDSTWQTFGGLSFDAEWKPPEYVAADGGIDGINVPLAVSFRTDEDNPTQVRG